MKSHTFRYCLYMGGGKRFETDSVLDYERQLVALNLRLSGEREHCPRCGAATCWVGNQPDACLNAACSRHVALPPLHA